MNPAHTADTGVPVLSADSVAVAYASGPARRILSDVGVDIRAGELAAIVGPNGSGKSTLVLALSRVMRPDSGAIRLDGMDLYEQTSARDAACAIGVVPQSTDVFLDFTVRDIVAMGRAPRRATRGLLSPDSVADDHAVEAALERMQLEPALAARPIGRVSGGERQRALIARMLAQEARVLLLDEPTAALDLAAQARLLARLRRLARDENCAVVVVLHDLNTAAEYADRIVVLDHGRVVAQGVPSEVLTSEMIERVYGVRTWVRTNPLSGRPMIVRIEIDDSGPDGAVFAGRRIHVFCGGGFGAAIMFRLAGFGADISVSIVQTGDPDDEAARALGLRAAIASPYCALSADSERDAENLASAADAAVLCRTPIGQTNSFLLESARLFVRAGKPLVGLRRAPQNSLEAHSDLSRAIWVDSESEAIAALAGVVSGGGRVA